MATRNAIRRAADRAGYPLRGRWYRPVLVGLAAVGLASASPDARGQVGDLARLGAAIELLADGSPPWEDRPLVVAGAGVLTGTSGVADPGDDLGPSDGIVRTYDIVAVRIHYDVLDAPARALVLRATLGPELRWQRGEETRLAREGCPAGTTIDRARRVLVCRVGDVQVPPSVTGVVDAVARVRGSAPNGARPALGVEVMAANGRPDADERRCPVPLASGCAAESAPLTVSAALAIDSRKTTGAPAVHDTTIANVRGWRVPWHLQILAGGDGDPRGDSQPAPGPYRLHDWWRVTLPDSSPVGGAIGTFIECSIGNAALACAQPGGDGSPVEITLADIDVDALDPTVSGPELVANRTNRAVLVATTLTLFVPRADVVAAGGTVRVENCFATVPGDPSRAELDPVDRAGGPNLGGLPEPLGDNCATVTLVALPDPPARAVPPDLVKVYEPERFRSIDEVVAGETIEGHVLAINRNVDARHALTDVVLCDTFDDRTQRLAAPSSVRTGDVAQAVARDGDASAPRRLTADEVIIEFATGPWGQQTVDRGAGWLAQARAVCDDAAPVNAAGWVTADGLDFDNAGGARLDAAEVNMVRARLRDPVPSGTTRHLRVALTVLPNPAGTWLVNYGALYTASPPLARWLMGGCYGAVDGRCPDPPSLGAPTRNPGPYGDARILVDAPTALTKRVASANGLVRAGEPVGYWLEARVARDSQFPLSRVATAHGVVITDVLPAGLTFVAGSAERASEDIDGNGRLETIEDVDDDGQLDPAVPVPPEVWPDRPVDGATTLVWRVGRIASQRHPLVIRYTATPDALLPGGRSLANQAEIRSEGEPPADCAGVGPFGRIDRRCAITMITVVNTSRAAVEKTAERADMRPGEPARFRLQLANLTRRPIEWVDAVDLLPWNGDPRQPPSRLSSPWESITVTVGSGAAPIEVWASAMEPAWLDAAGGSEVDGVMDPLAVYGSPGGGLRGADWPCPLADVGSAACPDIVSIADITALRFWAPDPDPRDTGSSMTSVLPSDEAPRVLDLWLTPRDAVYDDVFHNAWGGRFEGLLLPAFDDAVVRVPRPRIYLPRAIHIPACAARPIRLVLVVDASTSMRNPSGVGGTKLDAVVDAAGALAEALLGAGAGHEIAVVGFNDQAWVAQTLTPDAATARRALAGLEGRIAEGTRLDLGLAVGGFALRGAPRDRRAMIFLTDGLPNRVPTPIPAGRQEDTVLTMAAAVRSQGVVIHAIGYGRADAAALTDRVSPELLADIAGPGGDSAVTPDAARLAELFAELARDLACR